MSDLKSRFAQWRRDPLTFITEILHNPEDGKPFSLYHAEAQFLRRALTLTPDGRLPYPEMIFSAPKKSGKTALAAMAAIYSAWVLAGPYGEIYCMANDLDQAQARVFQAIARMIEASPLLRKGVKLTANKIELRSTGTFIQAVANDYFGFAGANPTLCVFDELWAYVHESSRRLWDEAVPSPVRKVSGRLVVTHAGFEGESELLEALYQRAMKGSEIAPDLRAQAGLLCYWTHECRAPWQRAEWIEERRAEMRANQFLRMIENRWVTSESSFVEMAWWDACVDAVALAERTTVPAETSAVAFQGYALDSNELCIARHFKRLEEEQS